MKRFNEGIAIFSVVAAVIFTFSIAFFSYTLIKNPQEILRVSKIIFIAVLVVTIAAVMILLFSKDEEVDDPPVEFECEKALSSPPLSPSPPATAQKPAERSPAPQRQNDITKRANPAQVAPPTKKDDSKQTPPQKKIDLSQNKEESQKKIETLKENAELSTLKEVYSQKSGAIKESLFNKSLNSRLIFAASNSEDLGLIEVDFGPSGESDLGAKAAVDLILSVGCIRDSVFDAGGGKFFIIMQKATTDSATDLSKKILKATQESVDFELEKVFFGVTTRAGRITDAERMRQECDTALERAKKEDTSKIVTFHVDLGRYRDEMGKE